MREDEAKARNGLRGYGAAAVVNTVPWQFWRDAIQLYMPGI